LAKTLLQIAQAAMAELGQPMPTIVANSPDRTAQQLLALLNLEGEELADVAGAWPGLRGEQTINLVSGQEAYDFPADILYYRSGTGWDSNTHWQVVGPLSDREWQFLRSGLSVAWPTLRYRIMNGQMHFDPVPTTNDAITFEYVSANWCQSAAGMGKSAFSADTDFPLIPDRLFIMGLKWRFLAAKGMNYAEERAEYDNAVGRKQTRSFVSPNLPLGRRAPRFHQLGMPPIPDGNWPSS